MIVGHLKSYGSEKACRCGNDMWLVDEIGENLYWVCNRCAVRIPIDRDSLKGPYPSRMKRGRPGE
jgi:hypothetical protein